MHLSLPVRDAVATHLEQEGSGGATLRLSLRFLDVLVHEQDVFAMFEAVAWGTMGSDFLYNTEDVNVWGTMFLSYREQYGQAYPPHGMDPMGAHMGQMHAYGGGGYPGFHMDPNAMDPNAGAMFQEPEKEAKKSLPVWMKEEILRRKQTAYARHGVAL